MKKPILSIYIPTYNRADKVCEQLKFLLKELEQENIDRSLVEIVVNDNCSTDNTREKIKSIIHKSQVVYHRNSTNLGIVGNIYKAVELVQGKYFWAISDDDVLYTGIVKRVLDIILNNPKVSYIFLNYSDINYPEQIAYNGPGGLINNAVSMITGQYVNQISVLFLTTTSIYLRESLENTIEKIPLEKQESYGWSGFAALVSLKKGSAYFETSIWAHNDAKNMSWSNIVYESNMGVLRMFAKLKKVGYTRREILNIYHYWISDVLIGGKIIHHLYTTKDIFRFIQDYGFCMTKAPKNVVKISFKLIYGKIFNLLSLK